MHAGAAGQTLTVLGKCLDVTAGGTANGTPVQLYDYNNTGAQLWTPQPDGSLRSPSPAAASTILASAPRGARG